MVTLCSSRRHRPCAGLHILNSGQPVSHTSLRQAAWGTSTSSPPTVEQNRPSSRSHLAVHSYQFAILRSALKLEAVFNWASEYQITMSDDEPQLVRPIPRRPFNLNLTGATPPDDDLADHDEPSQASFGSGLDFSSPRFLHPSFDRSESTASLSRPQSLLNLTSSTLMGIYSEAASNSRDRLFNGYDESDTPWGTGARTPIRRPSIDEATYELMRDRSHVPRRISSFGPYAQVEQTVSHSALGSVTSLTLRGTLLFVLGLGYGALVTRLHNEQNQLPPMPDDSILKPGNNWKYLTFWGVAGIGLGSLLPWFDKLWEDTFGNEGDDNVVDKRASPGTDWALVMRAIGAFVGIIFAIVSPKSDIGFSF